MPSGGQPPGGGLPWQLLSGKWPSGVEKSLSLGAGAPGFWFWFCLQLLDDPVRLALCVWASFLWKACS